MVQTSRDIYELIDPEIIYNDEDVCLLQGMYRDKQTGKETPVQSVLVRPNPASSQVTVTFLANNNSECYLHVTDLAGQIVKTIPLPCKQTSYSFSTSEMPSGLYIIELFNAQGSIGKAKFNIIR